MKPPKERGKPILPPCQVTRIRFSPNGQELAAACIDGIVRRWNVEDAKPLPDWKGHDGWLAALAHLPNGELLSADSWGKLNCWSGEKVRWSIPAHDGWVREIAVHPKTATFATCGRDGFLRIRDAKSGAMIHETKIGTDLYSLAYTPDGGSLLVGDLYGTIRVFDSMTGVKVREIERKEFHLLDRIQDVGGVRSLVFSADGKTLYTAGSQPKSGGFVQGFPLLIAIDFASGKTLWSWKGASDNEGFIHDLRLLPNGHLAAVTSGQPGQGKFLLFEPPNPVPYFTSTKQQNCHGIDFTLDGKRIAVSATNANSSGNGRVKGKSGEYPENTSPIQFWELG